MRGTAIIRYLQWWQCWSCQWFWWREWWLWWWQGNRGGAENNHSRNGDHLSSASVTSGSDESVSVLRNNRSVKILSFQEIQIQHMNKMKETIYIYISYIFWWCQDFLHIGASDNFGFTQVGQPAPYGPVQLPLHSTELKNIIIKTTMTTGWINKFESHVEGLNWLTNRALSSSMVLPLWYLKRITKSDFRAPTT